MNTGPRDHRGGRHRLIALIRAFPADLAAVVALVFLTAVVTLAPVLRTTPFRLWLGLVMALFVPGYALIAALFPEAGAAPDGGAVDEKEPQSAGENTGIDTLERLALSFGMSIAVTVLVALTLNFTPWGIKLVPILVGLGGVTLLGVAVAYGRRRALPADERFKVHFRKRAAEYTEELRNPPTRVYLVLTLVLVVSFLLATASVGFAVTSSPDGEPFTEFSLLTENESGDLAADDYPTNFVVGETRPLVVGVGNHEGEPTNYTVVVELHRVANGTDGPRVREVHELDQFTTPRLDDGETWSENRDVAPTMTGERLRLTYMLYRGEAPEDPALDNAYRETHLWITVRDTDEAGQPANGDESKP